MAQDGPHDHQDTASSDECGFAPPPTVTFLLSPGENDYRGSRTGSPVRIDASKGKEIVPNALHGEELGSASSGKDNDSKSKGKNIITEQERRSWMKELFSTLHELMPHVSKKVDKATLVGETIHYISALEQTLAELEKRKQEQALAWQAATEAASSSMPVPHTAQGMAAMSDALDPMPQQQQPEQQPLAVAAAMPPSLAAAVEPVGFRMWSTPNIVLSIFNDKAIINMCFPRQPHLLSLVASVLNKYNIDVISLQFSAYDDRSLFTIHTRVTGAGSENPPVEGIYKLALSEIMVWLSS